MKEFQVSMITTASAVVTIQLSDEEYAAALTEYAEDTGETVESLTPEQVLEAIREKIEEKTFEDAPGGLCIYCSGMGIGSNFSADLDEWQLDDGRFFDRGAKRVEYIRRGE